MDLISLVFDNFFDDPDKIREHAVKQAYKEQLSPDGVVYPDISIELTEEMIGEFVSKLQVLMGAPIKDTHVFLRLSKEGAEVPHQAHTDWVMGHWTALVYLNPEFPAGSGTSLLKHVSGMDSEPQTPEQYKLWRQDTNDPTKWVVEGGCPMKYNRIFIVRSDLFHRAEPIGGFGKDNETGRLAFICFFKLDVIE